MRIISLSNIVRSILSESDAGEEAQRLGLSHKGWGRYYDKDGVLKAKSIQGKLVKVSPNDPENTDPDHADALDRLNADPDAPSKMGQATSAFAASHSKDDPAQVEKLKHMQKITGLLRQLKDDGAEFDDLSPETQQNLRALFAQSAAPNLDDPKALDGDPAIPDGPDYNPDATGVKYDPQDQGVDNYYLDRFKREPEETSPETDDGSNRYKGAAAPYDDSENDGWDTRNNPEPTSSDDATRDAMGYAAGDVGDAEADAALGAGDTDMPSLSSLMGNKGKKPLPRMKKTPDDNPSVPYRSTMHKVVDWGREEAKAKSMSSDELTFAAKDAIQARDASKGWNANGEGYYQDLASVYAMELRRRQQGKSKEPARTKLSDLMPDKWDDPEYLQQSRDDDDAERNPGRYGPDQ